jgi:hypothetical protein
MEASCLCDRPHPIDHCLRRLTSAYRLPPANDTATTDPPSWSVGAGFWFTALLIGLTAMATTLTGSSAWGAEPTIGLLMAALGALGLAQGCVRAWRAQARYRTCTPIELKRD